MGHDPNCNGSRLGAAPPGPAEPAELTTLRERRLAVWEHLAALVDRGVETDLDRAIWDALNTEIHGLDNRIEALLLREAMDGRMSQPGSTRGYDYAWAPSTLTGAPAPAYLPAPAPPPDPEGTGGPVLRDVDHVFATALPPDYRLEYADPVTCRKWSQCRDCRTEGDELNDDGRCAYCAELAALPVREPGRPGHHLWARQGRGVGSAQTMRCAKCRERVPVDEVGRAGRCPGRPARPSYGLLAQRACRRAATVALALALVLSAVPGAWAPNAAGWSLMAGLLLVTVPGLWRWR